MSQFSAAAADEYDRFMGRYAVGLAPAFADAAGVSEGMRVLDVGCGTGALTVELARRVGEDEVAAIDPTQQWVAACQERVPGADVREGVAEALPWDDGEFDAAICSLVIAFMSDSAQGLREMVRVTRPGGTVAACMWDFPGGGMPMIDTFWRGVRSVDPERPMKPHPPGTHEGELAELLRAAGLGDVTDGTLETSVAYSDFHDFWEPFTYGAGPASSSYLASLDPERREAVRDAVRALVPDGGFELQARAWVACGRVADAS